MDGAGLRPKVSGVINFGPNRTSVADHIFCNNGLSLANASYVTEAGGWHLAGGSGALSDHAAVLASVARE